MTINEINIFYFEKSSKSKLSSMQAEPNINVVNNFYFFKKSSETMSTSMEAKPTMNVINKGSECNHHFYTEMTETL
jgi:hypothetical protein